MKKILLVLILVLNINCSFAQEQIFKDITNSANVLYAENNIKKAMDMFISIPEEERTAQNWLLMGNILQDQGKTDEAIFMYKKSIQSDEKYYKAYYNLGNTYLRDNKPNMAIEQYKKVIKLKPDYAYAHYNLACAYIQLGKYNKAKYELFNAIDCKSTVPDFYYNLAFVYKQSHNDKQAAKYLEHYNKLMETSCIKE